jgi:hypothetical protein
VNEGKSPALSGERAKALLDAPGSETLKGLRDRGCTGMKRILRGLPLAGTLSSLMRLGCAALAQVVAQGEGEFARRFLGRGGLEH